jgi:hypothetical protein
MVKGYCRGLIWGVFKETQGESIPLTGRGVP